MVFLLQSGRWEKSSCVYFTCHFSIDTGTTLFDICSLFLNKKKVTAMVLVHKTYTTLYTILGLVAFSLFLKIN